MKTKINQLKGLILFISITLLSCNPFFTSAHPPITLSPYVKTNEGSSIPNRTPSISSSHTSSPTWTSTPTPISGLRAIAISVWADVTCVVTDKGGVKCWSHQPHGDPHGQKLLSPIPLDIIGLESGVKDVAIGFGHGCTIMMTGEVECWNNDSLLNQFSIPKRLNGLPEGIVSIGFSDHQVCALLNTHAVKCWRGGDTNESEETYLYTNPPVNIDGLTGGSIALVSSQFKICAVTGIGGIKCWGGQGTVEVADYSSRLKELKIANISFGDTHSCLLTDSGGVKCWGFNSFGELGNGHTDDPEKYFLVPSDVIGLTQGLTAISAGSAHTCALDSAGGVKCWGWNANGQLGNGTNTDSSIPVEVFGLQSGVAKIVASGNSSCALMKDGSIRCWGMVLDDGLNIPIEILTYEPMYRINKLATGYDHACIILDKSITDVMYPYKIKCWGKNEYGQLGDGTRNNSKVPVEVNLSNNFSPTGLTAGKDHTCAMDSSGEIACWGKNESGQLGDGTTIDRAYPVIVAEEKQYSTTIIAGGNHTCTLNWQTGEVMCWGDNQYGQLGDGTNVNRSVPGKVKGLENNIQELVLGEDHTCVRTKDLKIKCWGRNDQGQLGNGTTQDSNIPVDVVMENGAMEITAGYKHTCAWTTMSPYVQCWGSNQYGQLGDGTKQGRSVPGGVSYFNDFGVVLNIVTRGNTTCIMAETRGTFCWGDNQYGQLGDGTTSSHTTPEEITDYPTSGAGLIAPTNGDFLCAIDNNNDLNGLVCWGENTYGQLGDGTTTNRSRPVRVIGITYE